MTRGLRGIVAATGVLGLAFGGLLDGAVAQPGAGMLDHAATDCSVVKPVIFSPSSGLANWPNRSPAKAAKDKAGLGAAMLPIGQAVDATLPHTPEVRYLLRPEKPGGSVSYGGMFGFAVKVAGTYRVALGAGAWIDVVKGGQSVASTAHGHGPDCSGIRKMVDFPLMPGRYVLQLAANGEEVLPVMIVQLP